MGRFKKIGNGYLLVIDMQNDFIYGSLGTDEAKAIVEKVKEKVYTFTAESTLGHVFFTKDIHYNTYLETHEGMYLPVRHCIEGTEGCNLIKPFDSYDFTTEISSDLGDDMTETISPYVINKSTFGVLEWEKIVGNLDYADFIELIGVCTDICVISNALILRSMYPEKEIIVDASCCAGTTPEKHKSALEVMKSCHIRIINE